MTETGRRVDKPDIDVRGELNDAMRHAFVVSTLIFAATIAVAGVSVTAVISGFIAAKVIAAGFVFAFVAVGWWGRTAHNLVGPVTGFMALGAGGVVLAAAATGGLTSFITPLIVIVPLAAGFLVDVRASLAVAVLAVLALLGIEAAESVGLVGDSPAMGAALVAAVVIVLSSASFLSALYMSAVVGHLDLFARRTADRRFELESLVKSMPYAIAMFDKHMHCLRCSDRWLEDYGLADAAVIGRSLYDFLPDAPEHWRNAHRRCLDGAVEANDGEDVVGADGAARMTAWRARPWRGVDGAIGGVVISSRDISREGRPARKAVDSAANMASNEPEANSQYSEEAHQALRIIAGSAELLARTNLEPYQAKMVQSLLSASESLGETIGFPGEAPSGA